MSVIEGSFVRIFNLTTVNLTLLFNLIVLISINQQIFIDISAILAILIEVRIFYTFNFSLFLIEVGINVVLTNLY